MYEPREYDFLIKLTASYGETAGLPVTEILMKNIAGAQQVIRASDADDRSGTDYWVECDGGVKVSVDLKSREEDYRRAGEDDLAIETWSVIEKRVIGWSRDTKKQSHYILWHWKDSGRWCLVPFRMLCAITASCWKEWVSRYKTRQQFTPRYGGGYHSECVFVPRKEIWRLIYQRFGGDSFVLPPKEWFDVDGSLEVRQARCAHKATTPTIVGGFTCNDCGRYLFRRAGESYKPTSPENRK